MIFADALKIVLENEGGYSNHPSDRGSQTAFGITEQTLSEFLGRELARDELRNISMDLVAKIYKQNYWDRMNLDKIQNSDIQLFLFDQGVNRGPRTVAQQLQIMLGTKSDGIIGPQTILAISQRDPKRLLLDLIKTAQLSYVTIVVVSPDQVAFLRGWLARTHKYMERLL